MSARSDYVDLKAADPREWDHLGRPLTCTKCGCLVIVHEFPRGFLNPDTFVGGCCLVEIPEAFDDEPPL